MKHKDRDKRTEIRLAGEGGQGMILAGIILAEAAAIYDGKNAVQTQSYGPEARGGTSKSEVVISEEAIDYPKVISADILVATSQEACDKYTGLMARGGLLIVDKDQVGRVLVHQAVRAPISRLAAEVVGQPITANVVALGVLVGLSGVVSREAIEKAVLARAPRGTEEINRAALAVGFAEAARIAGG
ncbi:MAG: 2-oxoglutarate ferredoxin oxidoreductase subunit gamma [Chloroflexi bacterium HGW-Chloroflexi-1]|nr:MAG: 2-oxoglutarate ferredoxin oxidoreductase subunit gamma [Chloroflexi bacterium HGW-Chloroflexi-1]